ncbi:MAG: polysaccharide deacetylase family protein [bacterium]
MDNLTLGLIILLVIIVSCRWNWWRLNQKGVAILMYHKIGIPPKSSRLKKLWVSPQKFARQMAYLTRHKYSIITMKEFVDNLIGNKSMSDKTVIITFDDGYKDTYSEAFPVLQRYNFKATIFLSVGYIGGKNQWEDPQEEPLVPMLNWDQIQQMLEYGMDFGSHTLTHANLLTCQIEPKRLDYELKESKKILENKLHWPIISFAYPYGAGANNWEIKEEVRKAGYIVACGIKQGKFTVPLYDAFNLRRLLVRGDDNLADFWLNLKTGRARF